MELIWNRIPHIGTFDTFPTAMYIVAVNELETKLFPAILLLKEVLKKKMVENKDIVKTGRTHLQDAVPLTVGQEMGGWHRMVERSEEMIKEGCKKLMDLTLGGTAVAQAVRDSGVARI